MFPVEIEHSVLETLPLLSAGDVTRVKKMLASIMVRRVVPHFRQRRVTDAGALTRLVEGLTIARLEEDERPIRVVSLPLVHDDGWTLLIHERVFEFLGFVLPSDPEHRLRDGTPDELKMLAVTELLLRHEAHHILYPDAAEVEVVAADLAFALEKRESDPTFYRMLRTGLADELNGLRGGPYLGLLELGERGEPTDEAITEIVANHARVLAELSGTHLIEVFEQLDPDMKTRLLGECYQRSRSTSFPLLERASSLRRVFLLFASLLDGDGEVATTVFNDFQRRWGMVELLTELGESRHRAEATEPAVLFDRLKTGLARFMERNRHGLEIARPPTPEEAPAKEPGPPQKSLKDRIEEAQHDPSIPRQVIEVILKNRVNAVGHSGAKYSELIETLLAIPWGQVRPITVTPQEFEQGLERSHYGLERAKSALADFFTNLIWRCQSLAGEPPSSWQRTGSAFLFVGPPGVGKTSLAISVAENLGIPYHKMSLGGMRDEADLRGHGFTYEGSKPGAIVQGLIKMEVMNGLYIMDEADKTEAFAIATLLEILDPEQNHLFHDKYTQSTVDVDLSNCHFVLTANTLETVPPPVVNRCQVVQLDRYAVDEKVAIARRFLIPRILRMHGLTPEDIYLEPGHEEEYLRELVRSHTHEAGVRELERILRTLFLRVQRTEMLASGQPSVCVTHRLMHQVLDPPERVRQIADDDRVGEALGLGVNVELGLGTVIPIQATTVASGADDGDGWALSMVHATGNIEKVMDESRKVASTALSQRASELGLDVSSAPGTIHLHFMGGSTRKDGPSAGGAIALALASLLSGRRLRRDVAMTGELDTHGRVTGVGAVDVKLDTASSAGCMTVIVPRENLTGAGGIERFPEALRRELQVLTYEDWRSDHAPFDFSSQVLQVVAVEDIVQAWDVAAIDDAELAAVAERFAAHGRRVARTLAAEDRGERRGLLAMVVKDVHELDPHMFGAGATARFARRRLLVPADRLAEVAARRPEDDRFTEIVEFDPAAGDLGEALRALQAAAGFADAELTLVAPFFMIKTGRPDLGDRPAAQVTLCANNYAVQGIKLKGAKPLMNRVLSHLARLGADDLEGCPFLARLEGIWVLDLAAIPEKYRLDVERAERILGRCLVGWLAAVEGPAGVTD